MPEITAITPQKKDKTRCNIEIDGRFYCGMKLETVVKNRLKAGMTISEEALSEMQLESEKMTALDKALTHITATMKTEKDIRDFLKKKGYLEGVTDYVVEKMKGYSYLDDGAYAAAYAESALKKGKGRRLIEAELKRKGVSDTNIQNSLDILSKEEEEESAFQILEKYLRSKARDQKTYQKAYGYLLGKGFDYDTARAALERVKREDD